jgi:phosphatidylglycerol phospholipase C
MHPGWETILASRLILGPWHPKFLKPAVKHLPLVRRFRMSMSIDQVRKYFFDTCHGFSVWYHALATADGACFLAQAAAAGKHIVTWTVNDRDGMLQCARWGLHAVISDKPELWREVKRALEADPRILEANYKALPLVSLVQHDAKARKEYEYLERETGAWHVPEPLESMQANFPQPQHVSRSRSYCAPMPCLISNGLP